MQLRQRKILNKETTLKKKAQAKSSARDVRRGFWSAIMTKVFKLECQGSKPRNLTPDKPNWIKPTPQQTTTKCTFHILQLLPEKVDYWTTAQSGFQKLNQVGRWDTVVRNNFTAAQATNFDRKDEPQRQINRSKKQEFAESLKKPDILPEKYKYFARWKATLIINWECAICKKWLTANPLKSSQTKQVFRNNRTEKESKKYRITQNQH